MKKNEENYSIYRNLFHLPDLMVNSTLLSTIDVGRAGYTNWTWSNSISPRKPTYIIHMIFKMQLYNWKRIVMGYCSLTNSCPSVDVLSIVGVRSNRSKKVSAAAIDEPIRSDLEKRQQNKEQIRTWRSYKNATICNDCNENIAKAKTLGKWKSNRSSLTNHRNCQFNYMITWGKASSFFSTRIREHQYRNAKMNDFLVPSMYHMIMKILY